MRAFRSQWANKSVDSAQKDNLNKPTDPDWMREPMDWVSPVGVTFSKENDGDMHDLGKCRPVASPAHPTIALMT